MTDNSYNHRTQELYWQRQWEQNEVFRCDVTRADKDSVYYVLEMFPYPSGRIHMGHVRNYTLGDIVARLKKMQGHTVLHPMGWDAFGLPAENAARLKNSHPRDWTYDNIKTMRAQLQRMGFGYDWTREIASCHPDYYKHEQKMFLDFLAKDLLYRKESIVNWDPVEQSVLANEQVIDGRGWRSGAQVQQKKLTQWFMRISRYSQELLDDLAHLTQWSPKVIHMQENWIGKGTGARVHFRHDSQPAIDVFTTRPDTLFGASFLAIAAAHPLAEQLARDDAKLARFIKECLQSSTKEQDQATTDKKGYDTGLRYPHPLVDGQELPLYVANFILMEYGTGAIFGCPAHDERDHEFAIRHRLPIRQVIEPPPNEPRHDCWTGDGILINSQFLNGLNVEQAKQKMIDHLTQHKHGASEVTYRLRDWCVSRQRYWGCPIPVVYCDACGMTPLSPSDLPVLLPEDVDFSQQGNPLSRHEGWLTVQCPQCGGTARRESDTLDTFFESSWYFARFVSPRASIAYDADAFAKAMPVDLYVGGIEHAVLHLLYARFFMRALRDCGYRAVNEPFAALLTQGMVCHQSYQRADGSWVEPKDVRAQDGGLVDAQGMTVTPQRIEKMSKSKSNVIDPDDILHTYGADVARLFIVSDSPPMRDFEWREDGVKGTARYLKRLWKVVTQSPTASDATQDEALQKKQHQTIAAVTKAYDQHHFNRVVALLHSFTNDIENTPLVSPSLRHDAALTLVQLFHPIIPHITEEMHQKLGGVSLLASSAFPIANEAYLSDDTVTIAVQINGKRRGQVMMAKDSDEVSVTDAATELDNVAKYLQAGNIRKVIFVPNRLINLIIS